MSAPVVAARPSKDPLSAGELCTRVLTIVRRDTPLVDAARRMRDEHVGCVLVAEESPVGDTVVGMLTDRDVVVSVVALGIDAATLFVEDAMATDVALVRETASLGEVLALVRERGVRRVPVVGEDGTLVGLLSFDDLVAALALQAHAMTEALVVGRQREGASRP
ncbi:MAG TPA: CBS domain-containing protein [Burkholderiaceae bacterium]